MGRHSQMKMLMRFAAMTAAALLATTTLCCTGDGVGLNEFGDPTGTVGPKATGGPLEPTLESIETNIFQAICAVKCHRDPRPKKGLNLEPGKAYDLLVGVASKEVPSMMRVEPGDAENSYIIWKLEGRSGIRNKRMPLNQKPLADAQIEAIREWINNGAQP